MKKLAILAAVVVLMGLPGLAVATYGFGPFTSTPIIIHHFIDRLEPRSIRNLCNRVPEI